VKSLSRIQCAVDFGDASLAAFEYGLALAKRQSAELSLVFAVPLGVRFNPRGRQTMDRLAKFRRVARAEGVSVSVTVQQGDPAELILRHAKAQKPDALVIGTHGRVGMQRFRFGSVATRVVQEVSCPTFVVPAFPSDLRAGRIGMFDRILCATDFSAASGAALHQAIDLVKRGKRLTLLHVLRRHPFLHPRRPWNFVHTDAWPRIHRIVPPLSPDLREKVRPRLSEGTVAKEVLRVAAETRADLIVVGVSARRGLSKWFGSTAARILRTSKIPVLAVPERARVRTIEGTSRRVA
jgi:nucleotide-binding universal stress UspA family protein